MINFYRLVNRRFNEISAKYGKEDAAKLIVIASTLSAEGVIRISTSNARAAVLGGMGLGIIPPTHDGTENGDLFTVYDRHTYKRNRYGMLVKR